MKTIGYIHTDFKEKFGIPRQSNLVKELEGYIIMEPEYRQPEAFRGLEDFSYIWLLWDFSMAKRQGWSATVKPPKLGGNKRMGVFATRSPFRPNSIGLSSVKLERIEYTENMGPVLYVTGVDLMDNTPIYDIKPYLAYTDSHPDATGGFTNEIADYTLEVVCPEDIISVIPEHKRTALINLLKEDPRPGYQYNSERSYGVFFGGFDVHFHVSGKILTVYEIIELS